MDSERLRAVHVAIAERITDQGAAMHVGGMVRADSTALALIALAAAGWEAGRLRGLQRALLGFQMSGGNISLTGNDAALSWPTPLAILGWISSGAEPEATRRAVDYLLEAEGQHYERGDPENVGHDTSIVGWPWIMGTHSWAEPTAMAVLALDAAGEGDHDRCIEGRKMLLDRQIATGGWNYGNTVVLGAKLRPTTESTAIVLTSLAGWSEEDEVAESLKYLRERYGGLSSPLSLAWAVLAFGAWGQRPDDAEEKLLECFSNTVTNRSHSTVDLSLLAFACTVKGSNNPFKSVP